ncbi:MAG: hypothetical protein H6851_04430 [Geminicoccaceae bacterium]|nr:hypothetical protein [Geminicoccaceae bacterium]
MSDDGEIRWVIKLEGSQWDLDFWKEAFTSPPYEVHMLPTQVDGTDMAPCVWIPEVADLVGEEFVLKTRDIFGLLNGIAAVARYGNIGQVRPGHYYPFSRDWKLIREKMNSKSTASGKIGFNFTVNLNNPISDIHRWNNIILHSEYFQDAIKYYSQSLNSDYPWVDLYNAREVMFKWPELDKNARRCRIARLHESAGTGEDVWKNFLDTANHHRHSGLDQPGPQEPMTLVAARRYVGRLIRAALDEAAEGGEVRQP